MMIHAPFCLVFLCCFAHKSGAVVLRTNIMARPALAPGVFSTSPSRVATDRERLHASSRPDGFDLKRDETLLIT